MEFSELFYGGPVFSSADGVFAPGTDAVALSDFADTDFAENICDIGCGCGVLSIVAALRSKTAKITALDIQPEACTAALHNARANGLEDRINIICGDVREYKQLFTSGSFDCIVSNPPYFPPKSGKVSKSAAIARQELCCTLTDLIAAVSFMLKYGGYFYLVHRADRAAQVISALSAAGLEPKVMRFVQHSEMSDPSLVLIKCKKGGKAGVIVMRPLVLANVDGTKSAEIIEIYNKRWLKR